MKGPKAVSWFSRCRAGLAATNGDEEPWTCPPHASMVRDRKLLLLPLVNPLCFSPLFPPIFSSFFSPPPLYFPHRPSSSRPISSVQSLLLIRSTLSFLMEGTFSPSLTLSTTERVLVASSLRNTEIRENRDIYYYYYYWRISSTSSQKKKGTYLFTFFLKRIGEVALRKQRDGIARSKRFGRIARNYR